MEIITAKTAATALAFIMFFLYKRYSHFFYYLYILMRRLYCVSNIYLYISYRLNNGYS